MLNLKVVPLGPKVKVYEKKNGEIVEINFVKTRRYMIAKNHSILEKEVYLGIKEKFKTRLIIHLMPEAEITKRIRKAQDNNKKKSRKPLSDEYIARAHLNLFITNAPASIVPQKHVWNLYRLRWQIELIFKIWKSICDIEKVKKVKKDRLECYIYSKLILITLGWNFLWKIAQHLFTFDGKAMSFFKAFKSFVKEI